MTGGDKVVGDAHHADDDDYNSADDHDFDPNENAQQSSSDDDNDDDDDDNNNKNANNNKICSRASLKSTKVSALNDDAPGFDNSGDESTLAKAARKKKVKSKNRAGSGDEDEDDEGGTGGLVKTRAQRRAEVKERKPLVQASASSIDVDSLWASMHAAPSKVLTDEAPQSRPPAQVASTSPNGTESADTVVIKRTFEFAGQVMEEEKAVKASSAEAKLYREQQAREQAPSAPGITQPADAKPLRRPMKRKSMFAAKDGSATAKGPRLNTLQKSRLDWAAHIDKEGIADELQEHQRAKDSYTGRMDFLDRMDTKREQQHQGPN